MKRWCESEEELARKVVAELQRQGFTTYEEVSCGYGSERADIVGVRGPVVAVVECKVGLTLALLDQVTHWIGRAHIVIAAYGFSKRHFSAERLAALAGFGLWSVGADEIHVKAEPRLHRRAPVDLIRRRLHEAQRTGEYAKAGTQGGYWTPFRQTCAALLAIVKEQPGIELRDALKAIDHHYSSERSAKSAIPALIRSGVIEGIEVDTSSRAVKLYPKGELARHQLLESA